MRIMLAAAAVLALSTGAFAADDVMANYYGNTVVGKSSMFESHTHYKADHSFTASYSSAMGSLDVKGTWAIDGTGQLCRTFDSPPPGVTNPVCVPWASHKVGETWQMTSSGRSVDVTLVAGVK